MVSQFDWLDIRVSYSYLCFGLLSLKTYRYLINDRL